jgi:2-keto-4-pentenoate hydratase/2-oxohepta-3-ene-1,7-dioic acid hydratase in catechol pathway
MKRILVILALASIGAPNSWAQAREPFKLGTFENRGQVFLGLVLRDSLVVNISQANAALPGVKLAIPTDMKDLIVRYDELRPRLYAIADAVAAAPANARPAYAMDVKAVKTLPPVMPQMILNAAVNFTEHANEMARRAATPAPSTPAPKSMPGLWERKAEDARHNPYLFLKSPNAIVADGEAIRIPSGRDRVDWECELTAVVAKPASRVPVERADEYIFGYTLENDVSDRGGRGDTRHGSDWLIGKSHDTFAPLGPYIVPREFVKDPQKLAVKFTLSGKVMQDSNTDRMTHTAREMLHFASNIITLKPGDLIALGSPAGVGAARETPIFMKNGDVSVCTIESIGTLTNPVVATATTSSR